MNLKNPMADENTIFLGFFKKFFTVLSGSAVALMLTVACMSLLTHQLTEAEYGLLVSYLAVPMFLLQCITGPINYSILRFYGFGCRKLGKKTYTGLTFLLIVGLFVILFLLAVSIFIAKYFLDLANFNFGYLAICFLYAAINSFYGFFNSILNGSDRQRVLVFMQIINPGLRFFLLLFFVNYYDLNLTISLLCYVIGIFLVVGVQVSTLPYAVPSAMKSVKVVESLDWREVRVRIFKYSRYSMFWGIFTGLYLSIDKWALGFFESMDDVAIYAILYQLGYMPFSHLAVTISQAISPNIFKFADSGDDLSKIKYLTGRAIKISGVGMIIILIFSALTSLLSSEFIYIIIPESYSFEPWLFTVMLCAGMTFGLSQSVALAPLSNARVEIFATVKIISAIFGICSSVLLTFSYGLHGAILAQLSHSFFYFTSLLVCMYISLGRDN